ncbi:MAG: DnaD domain protein [Clostridia bacterium]
MSFYLNFGIWNSVFAVPTNLIDNHLKNCDEYSLKLMLTMLRYPTVKFSKEDICDKAGIPYTKFESSLNYWVNSGLISCNNSEIAPKNSNIAVNQAETSTITTQKMLRPDSIYISKRLHESPELSHLFSDSQAVMGKTLSPSLSAVLIIAYDDYCLPIEVITMLISYCVSINRTSPSFIETLAKNWYELGVSNLEQAEARIEEMNERSTAWKSFCSTINLPYRQPIKSELDLAHDVINNMKFSREMIIAAYEETVIRTGKLQPKYMHKILTEWYKKRITNKAMLENEKSHRQSKTSNTSSTNANVLDNLNIFDSEEN